MKIHNMGKLYSAILVASIFTTGCQPTTSEQPENQVETTPDNNKDTSTQLSSDPKVNTDETNSTAAMDNITADEVTFERVAYDYQLPAAVKEACTKNADIDAIKDESTDAIACPEFDVNLAKVTPVWIEEIINKQITTINNNSEPTLLANYLDEIATYQIEDGIAMPYSVSKQPEHLGTHNNVAQFVIHSSEYTGGAHGMGYSEYLLFDMDLHSQISIVDVVQPDKRKAFFELGNNEFQDYLTSIDITTPEQIASYLEIWKFAPANNFYFNDTGLVMHYPAYELGSYAQGPIELTIPFTDLKDVLKPQYMPSN